jgi:hypothetical protein
MSAKSPKTQIAKFSTTTDNIFFPLGLALAPHAAVLLGLVWNPFWPTPKILFNVLQLKPKKFSKQGQIFRCQ